MDSEKDSTSAKQATAVSGYPSTAAKKRPRIVIADDDPRVLAEIGNFLGTDFDVVGHASNGRELLETVKRLNPALVVADLAMPEMDGLLGRSSGRGGVRRWRLKLRGQGSRLRRTDSRHSMCS